MIALTCFRLFVLAATAPFFALGFVYGFASFAFRGGYLKADTLAARAVEKRA